MQTAGASTWKEMGGFFAKDKEVHPSLSPRGGEWRGWCWVELAGIDEFPAGTWLVESKGTDLE